MWRRYAAICLALGLLLAPCSAWSEPLPSSRGVWLSTAEYDAIVAAVETAQAELTKSNQTIDTLSTQLKISSEEMARLSRDLTLRSVFCATLGAALVLNGVGLIVAAIR